MSWSVVIRVAHKTERAMAMTKIKTMDSQIPSREFMVWPPNLFDETPEEPGAIAFLPGEWWVLHTRSRVEKSLARQLAEESVPHFLPLFERRKRLQRRIVRTHLPLFPGYLFLYGDDDARRVALDSNQVANCLKIQDQETMQQDLERILRLIEAGTQLSPESRMQPGMPARIIKGPMAGLEGTVVRRKSGFRFIVRVNFLQQGAGIEIDDCMLEPI